MSASLPLLAVPLIPGERNILGTTCWVDMQSFACDVNTRRKWWMAYDSEPPNKHDLSIPEMWKSPLCTLEDSDPNLLQAGPGHLFLKDTIGYCRVRTIQVNGEEYNRIGIYGQNNAGYFAGFQITPPPIHKLAETCQPQSVMRCLNRPILHESQWGL